MTDYSKRFSTLATNVLHAGRPSPRIEGAVVSPIFQSANYLMADEDRYDAVRYIRLSNSPNHYTLQARLAAVEGAERAIVTASGMAAITATLLGHLEKGDHLLAQRTLYGGTQTFLEHDLTRFGIDFSAIDISPPAAGDSWSQLLTPQTRMIYVESISNPLMEVGDLEAVVAFARDHDLLAVIDNTFATPVNFRPLEMGFDVVVHSATKYLNGHSDIVAGVVAGGADVLEPIHQVLLHLGGSLDPHACFLLERGLKTLALRVACQNRNALEIARFLSHRPEVRRVNYPGLSADSSHEFASRWFEGFGGMLSFYMQDPMRAESFLDALELPVHAASLGAVETLVVRPALSSHLGLTPEERTRQGITEDLIRVSVGIENIDELLHDFGRALELR
ncbi:MAG: PLP-dependent aspartate aminotransferase family protein [Acidobacteriota bacterium]